MNITKRRVAFVAALVISCAAIIAVRGALGLISDEGRDANHG